MSFDSGAFRRFEHAGWEKAAGKYGDYWASLTALYVQPLLTAAGVQPGTQLLDVACGLGHLCARAREMGAEPVGIDFSARMIEQARHAHPGLDLREGDAENLELPAASFDAVVMNFVLLHLAHPARALSEARRVLRPGGRFAFTLWAAPEENPGARVVEDAVAAHADRSVPLPPGPDYFLFRDTAECRKALKTAGLGLETFQAVRVGWHIPSPDFYFEAERDAGVRTAGLLARQTPVRLAAIRDAIVRGVEQYRSGAAYEIPMVAYVVSAGA